MNTFGTRCNKVVKSFCELYKIKNRTNLIFLIIAQLCRAGAKVARNVSIFCLVLLNCGEEEEAEDEEVMEKCRNA